MRCRALRCCAVLRCAVFRTYIVPGTMRSTRYHIPVYMYVCNRLFCFLRLSSLGPHVYLFRKLHPYCRSERGIATKHTAQHRAIRSAQVPLYYQIASCTKSWASFCPLHMLLYSSLRERSGRRQPPAKRSPYARINPPWDEVLVVANIRTNERPAHHGACKDEYRL